MSGPGSRRAALRIAACLALTWAGAASPAAASGGMGGGGGHGGGGHGGHGAHAGRSLATQARSARAGRRGPGGPGGSLARGRPWRCALPGAGGLVSEELEAPPPGAAACQPSYGPYADPSSVAYVPYCDPGSLYYDPPSCEDMLP